MTDKKDIEDNESKVSHSQALTFTSNEVTLLSFAMFLGGFVLGVFVMGAFGG